LHKCKRKNFSSSTLYEYEEGELAISPQSVGFSADEELPQAEEEDVLQTPSPPRDEPNFLMSPEQVATRRFPGKKNSA
jgi:hypothetical protein